jgi:hypothetical protein
MSKVNQSLTKSVNKLLSVVGVKALSYEEVRKNHEITHQMAKAMNEMQAFHNNELDIIGVDDSYLNDSTELVLHELVHMVLSKSRLNIKYPTNEVGQQTEDAAAQLGMFKVITALDINAAIYENVLWSYLKTLPEADFDRAERDSDRAKNYLMGFLKERQNFVTDV